MLLGIALLLSPIYAEKVYETSPWLDGGITAAGAAASIIPYAFASKWINKRCPCNPNEINGIDRGVVGNHSDFAATTSDLLLAAAILGPPTANYFDLGWSEALYHDTFVYAETLMTAAGLVSIVKAIAQRPLPRTYEGDPVAIQSEEGYRSFYSGHVTMTVAALSAASFTIDRRYGESFWPWVTTFGVGTAVAAGRVLAGNHFYTDVAVGMGMGALVGTLIPHFHTVTGGKISLLPYDDGFLLTWGTRL